MSDTMSPAEERAKYETFLRLTKKRVRRDATDHDRALIGQGQTALLDRRDALLELKSRVNKSIRTRVERLDGEERSLRQLSKEKKREELRDAHVIVDSRQGGVILVRDAETGDVLMGPTPLSASQREVFAVTKTQTNFLDDPVAANDELARKLNLMEYLADDPPATVHERVAAALEEGDLPDDLKEQLLEFLAEDEAEREEAGPAPKKTKKEKPAKESKEPKKRGRPKKSESAPSATPPAPADSNEQPGPAVAEKDDVLPKSPPKAREKLSDEPAEGDRIPLVGEGDDEPEPTLDGSRTGLVETLSQRVAEHEEEDEESEAPTDDGDLAAIPEPEEPSEPESPEPVGESSEEAVPEAMVASEEPAAEGDDEIPDYDDAAPEPERFVEAEEVSTPEDITVHGTESNDVDKYVQHAASQPVAPETLGGAQGEPVVDARPREVPAPEPEAAGASTSEAVTEPKRTKKRDAPVGAAPKPDEPELSEANNWGMPEMNAKQLMQASEATVKNLVFFSPILIEQIEAESKTKVKAATMRKAMPTVFRDLAKKGVFTARVLPNGDTAYYLVVKTGAKPKNLTAERVEATIAAYLAGERDPAKLKSAK